MLNYTEKPKTPMSRVLTVWEIMAIENCGLLRVQDSCQLCFITTRLLAELRDNDAPVECISCKVSSARCGVLVSVW